MKKNLFSVLAVMAAFTLFTVSCGDKKSEKKENAKTETVEKKATDGSQIEKLIKQANTSLPQDLMEGLTLAEIAYENQSIAFYVDCDPEVYQSMVNYGIEQAKAQMLQVYVGKPDELQKAILKDEASVFYVYTNVDTDEKFEFELTPEEIAEAMGK